MNIDQSPPSDEADDGLDENGYSRPSKSQRKRDSHELQDLGEALVTMPKARLADIDMPESLQDAIEDYKRTKSFEGRRRQMQYIGKLMRGCDSEPFKEAVASFQLGHAVNALSLHEAERWRAELVADDKAMTRWVAEFPGADVQKTRALIRNARKDATAAPEVRSGRGFRELFQYVKQVLEAQEKAAPADAAPDDHDD
ncbi:MAG: ribosome biogenesis factor YjgA [Pseudomonadota bacterium]